MQEKVYFGTYNQGIYGANFDTETGKLTNINMDSPVGGPTYLDITDDNYMYAVAKDDTLGGFASYKIDEDIKLNNIQSELSFTSSPVHVSANNKNNIVLISNYNTGVAQVFSKQADGTLKKLSEFNNYGKGTLVQQNTSHLHFSYMMNDNRIVMLDLGTDQIFVWDTNEDFSLKEIKSIFKTRPGFGPRHVMFSEDGATAYLLGELASSIAVLKYDSATGTFTQKQIVSTLPDDWNGVNGCGGIHLAANGNFLYASNRGHDSIMVYKIENERLTRVQSISTEGNFPRDFDLDKSGRFLIAANQNTDNVSIYAVNQENGQLTLLESNISVPAPVCVKFLEV